MSLAGSRLVALACVAFAGVAVAWVHMLPAQLRGVAPATAGSVERRGGEDDPGAAYRFPSEDGEDGEDGEEYVYLGGYDGYAWARAARRLVRTGSVCDEVVDGVCRDLSAPAPQGRPVRYPRSLHVRAIALVHDALNWWRPHRPVLFAAFLVPVFVAVISVVPAFALGTRMAGYLGGLVTALLAAMNPMLLYRTIGGDNDIWNVFFPSLLVWFSVEAILARSRAAGFAWAALAGVAIGPYSATWNGWPFAWVVTVAGLLANTALIGVSTLVHARGSIREGEPSPPGDDGAHAAAWSLALVVAFVSVAGAATLAAGASPSYIDAIPLLLDERLLAAPAHAAASGTMAWPDAYARVAELQATNLVGVADGMGGQLVVFLGWLGVILMLLPRRGWRGVHFATFVGATLLYRLLLAASPQSRLLTVFALAAPLVAAVALYAADTRDGPRRRASIAIVVWFLAALFLGIGAVRYLLLLVVPLAIAVAVTADRLRGWARDAARSWGEPAQRLVASATAMLVCVVVFVALRPGWATARDYLPRVNDAWYDTLTRIRDRSEPDAIVSTWWDYGYFASYFAERSVTIDGGTQYTAGSYWVARAMMAPSARQTAGILRMLHCGAAPAPGVSASRRGPWHLVGDGARPYRVLRTIDALIRVDASAARRALGDLGLSDDSIAAVVRASHCRPPESFLVLSSRSARQFSWQRMAVWDFPRAFAAAEIARRPAAGVADELRTSFGVPTAAAAVVVDGAVRARQSGRLPAYVSPIGDVLATAWMPCTGSGSSSEALSESSTEADWNCAVRSRGVTGLDLRLGDPSASRLRGPIDWGAPAAVLVAGGDGVEERLADSSGGRWAVLFDPVTQRAAIGSAALLRSTYTHLMMLDGRYDRVFEKVADHAAAGERVTAWRVRWHDVDGELP